MPLTKPSASARNLRPISIALVSLSDGVFGVAEGDQIVHGQVTLTATPALAGPRLALSSAARALIWTEPRPLAVHEYVQLPRPLAGCQVWPPSVETSTPPTRPPPPSGAVPERGTCWPTSRRAPARRGDTGA